MNHGIARLKLTVEEGKAYFNVSSGKGKSYGPGVKRGDTPQTEPMTLSLLRARIRAGAYRDDQYALEEMRLLFLRWLVRRGQLNEWQVADEVRQEEPATSAFSRTLEPCMKKRGKLCLT